MTQIQFTQQKALERLTEKDQLFFDTWEHRQIYARLVMAGLARCYVIRGGQEYVRLATDEERRISARAGNSIQERV